MRRAVNVYLHEHLAGVLVYAEGAYHFAYEPDYEGPPLSLSLPKGKGVHSSMDPHPSFHGLAPGTYCTGRKGR